MGQGFDCDGSIYIVAYTQSTGVSVLYEVQERDQSFSYTAIELSEDRRLTSLAYNVLDKHLYALDVDTYELIKINRNGLIISLDVPASLDKDFIYNAGTISPNGSGIFLMGYSPEFGFDKKFYTINLSREDFYAGFLGVTGEARSAIHDFATDPTSGVIYGYDNLEGSLGQIAVGGLVSTTGFPNSGVTDIDGLFFNQEGELFGYAATKGFYAINKLSGELKFVGSGPGGTSGDACSCPYTSTFQKDVQPREILPCEEFEITYSYNNRLGIGQTWVSLRDTLPEGFEIIDIKSKIVTSVNIIESPSNIIALDNLIYLMRDNEIKVTVRAPVDYIGPFGSQATHWDFPFAFGEYQSSDDSSTDEEQDKTMAMIVGEEELDFNDYVEYSCDGKEVIITSPIQAESYIWSDGSSEESITTNQLGWYSLIAQNDCVYYHDSVFISEFFEKKELFIAGPDKTKIASPIRLSSSVNRGIPKLYQWYDGSDTITCTDCSSMVFTPIEDTVYELYVTDRQGCETNATIDVTVDINRDFYAATAFSPNNDGINDMFFLQSTIQGTVRKMSIFNRWGGEVFNIEEVPLNESDLGWDGSLSNGEPSSTGVFIWIAEIEYLDGFIESKTGTVTLITQN